MVEPKRRLPVLNSPKASEGPPRRAWQWVFFGMLGIVTTWVPLAAVAGAVASALARRGPPTDEGRLASLADAEVAVVASYVAALATGAVLGGFLVGRWGPSAVGVRHAALAGLGVSLIALAATWLSFGPLPGMWLVAAVVTPAAAVGGRLGVRGRSA